MSKISISKAVGKNCYGASSTDVTVIQLALRDHKHKTKFGLKPIYQGKIDGRAKKVTEGAIACFQQSKKIPVDGKVQTVGRTITALGTGLSMQAQKDIAAAQLGEKRTGAPTAAQTKVERAGLKSADTVKTQSPLPQAEAEALSKLIQSVSKRGIPLKLDQTDITNDGRFTVKLRVDRSSLPSLNLLATYEQQAPQALKDETAGSAMWSLPQAGKLKLISRTAYNEFAELKAPSKAYLLSIGLNDVELTPIQSRLLAAAEVMEKKAGNS